MRPPPAALAGLLLLCFAARQAGAQAGGPTIAANPTSGPAPLNVMFRVSAIPPGGTIDFGDGTTDAPHPAPVCYTCPPLATASHVYQRPGGYIARLVANGQPIADAMVVVHAN